MEDRLNADFKALVARVDALPPERQYLVQGELHALVERMLRHRIPLPAGLQELDDRLTDAAIEAQFDNLPV